MRSNKRQEARGSRHGQEAQVPTRRGRRRRFLFMNEQQLRKIAAAADTFVDDTCDLSKWKEAKRSGKWRDYAYMVNRLMPLSAVYRVHPSTFVANVGIFRN